jgi:hypothetical protein
MLLYAVRPCGSRNPVRARHLGFHHCEGPMNGEHGFCHLGPTCTQCNQRLTVSISEAPSGRSRLDPSPT